MNIDFNDMNDNSKNIAENVLRVNTERTPGPRNDDDRMRLYGGIDLSFDGITFVLGQVLNNNDVVHAFDIFHDGLTTFERQKL